MRLGTGEMSFAVRDGEEDEEGTHMTQTTAASDQSLKVEIMAEGEGPLVPNGATVTMHYNGYLEDDTLFDSSYTRGAPFTFKVGEGEVIKGWELAVIQLRKRSKAKLVIPSELAYGSDGLGTKVPPNATLIFVVEVFGFEAQ